MLTLLSHTYLHTIVIYISDTTSFIYMIGELWLAEIWMICIAYENCPYTLLFLTDLVPHKMLEISSDSQFQQWRSYLRGVAIDNNNNNNNNHDRDKNLWNFEQNIQRVFSMSLDSIF